MIIDIGRGARGGAVIGLMPVFVLMGAGCGTQLGRATTQNPWAVDDCGDGGDPTVAVERVVLKWGGGISPIYPDYFLDGLDLSQFETSDGGTLADAPEAFRESVRREIARVYCGQPEVHVVVRSDAHDELDGDTVVYLAQERQPGGGDIGEAEYDPCNRQHDNSAIIFGERILDLGDTYTFDEWVLIFANVTAHEIGHTLGYGHVGRDELDVSARSLFVELMLGHHTMTEMRQSQRFVVDQSNCLPLARCRSPALTVSGCTVEHP